MNKHYKRLLARLRSLNPVAFFLPGLILGQLAPYLLGDFALHLSAIMVVILIVAWRKIAIYLPLFGVVILGFIPGVVSMYALLHQQDTVDLKSGIPYLVKVDQRPRHQNIGAVSLSLQVLGEWGQGEKGSPLFSSPVRAWCHAIDVPWKNVSPADKDSVFVMLANFVPLKKEANPFSYSNQLLRQGYKAKCKIQYASKILQDQDDFLESAQKSLIQITRDVLGNTERAGVLLSMSMGTRDVISEESERVFKRTGLAHLLVASGYQVTLLYHLVFCFAQFLLTRSSKVAMLLPISTICSCVALVASLAFVFVAGVEGPTVRAALALLFVIVSIRLERGGGMGGAISVSLLILSIIWPGAIFDPGVELTYAALIGLFIGSSKSDTNLMRYIKSCTCACLCTSIVVLFWFGSFSFLTLPMNLILAPILSIIGCQGGFLSLSSYALGIDNQGYLLQGVSYLLMIGVRFVGVASGTGLWLERLDFKTSFAIAAICATLIIIVVKRRIWDFKTEYNL